MLQIRVLRVICLLPRSQTRICSTPLGPWCWPEHFHCAVKLLDSRCLDSVTFFRGTLPVLLTTYFRSTGIPSEVSGPGLVSASNQVTPLSVLMYNFTAIAEEERARKMKLQTFEVRRKIKDRMKEVARRSNPLTGTLTSTVLQTRLSLEPKKHPASVPLVGIPFVTAQRCGPRKTALHR